MDVELTAWDRDPTATTARLEALGAREEGVRRKHETWFQSSAGVQPALGDAGDGILGTTVVVSVVRREFAWEDSRIRLDDVDGLGTFVALAGGDVRRVCAELQITDDARVTRGYAELLLDGPQALLRAADAAMRRAYVPYSSFPVGAALRAGSGAIYAAANVENAAYPQSQCAEASAIGVLVAAGETTVTEVAVVAQRVEHCAPCGGCRQRLSEFAGPDVSVHLGRPGGAPPRSMTLGQLLPGAFGPEDLADR